jgi:F-type H+-transporting ATPase subunit b
MRSWLMIGVVATILAVALPAPSFAAAADEGHDKAKPKEAKDKEAGDHHARAIPGLNELKKAWAGLPDDERERALKELTRNMSKKDKKAAEEFFNELAKEYAEEHKVLGVEHGIFKGAIEVTLWTILVFVLLLVVLRRFAWGPILEGLNKREQSIARDKHEAELARKDAADTRTRLDAELARANDEVRVMIDKARQDAQKVAGDELTRGKGELQAERQRLFNDLRVAQDHALQDVWEQATRVATLISAKAIHKNLTEADHRALVNEALNEFRASAEKRKAEGGSAAG